MPISAFDYPETIKNFLSSPEFNEVPDEEKPLHIEGFRRSFIKENEIKDKIDLDFVNESSANMFGDYRKKLNIPRFTPTPEQSLDLYGPININPKDNTEKRITAIEQWRDQAKARASEKSPSTAEDFEYHVEDLANNYIKNELAKDSYKPGGAPDWLMDASKRFTENAIRGIGVDLLAEYKDTQRWFAKNLVENPEFDDDFSSQVAGGLGNVLSQVALSAGLTMAGAPELAPVALGTMSVARHMSESYQRELKRTGNELMAQDAAANAIPAGMIDAGPEIFLGGFFNKAKGFKEAFTAATTTEAKRQVIKDAIPGIVSTSGKGFLMEGLVGGVGTDVAQNMGDYLATGDKKYYEAATNIGELARSFAVEGTVGAIAGGMVSGITKSGNQEATAKVMAELSKKQELEQKVLGALKENNFDAAIRIVTDANNTTPATLASTSGQQSATPVKDTANATLKDRLGEDIVQQNKFKGENSIYTKPIDQTLAKLRKDPEANKAKIAELEKARLAFEDEKGPKQFVPQNEFELSPESIDLTESFAKKKSSYDVTLDDDTTVTDESTIFVKPEDNKNSFIRDINLRQLVKGSPGIKISANKINFEGSKKEYTTSVKPNAGWTPVQVINGKIKILPNVKSFVKKESAKPAEQPKTNDATPILQTPEEEVAGSTTTLPLTTEEQTQWQALQQKTVDGTITPEEVKQRQEFNRRNRDGVFPISKELFTDEKLQENSVEPIIEQATETTEDQVVEDDTVVIDQPEVNKLAEKLGIPEEQVPVVKPKKTRNRNKKKTKEPEPETIITPEPVQEAQPEVTTEPVVEKSTPEQPVNYELESVDSALKYYDEKLAELKDDEVKERGRIEGLKQKALKRKEEIISSNPETVTQETPIEQIDPQIELDKRIAFHNKVINDRSAPESRKSASRIKLAELTAEKETNQNQVSQPKEINKDVLKDLTLTANKKDGIKIGKLQDLIKRGFLSEDQFPILAEMYGAPDYNGDLDAFAKGLTSAIRKENAEQNKLLEEIEKYRNEVRETLFSQRENTPENKERRAQQTNAINSLAKDVGLKDLTIVNTHEELGRADVDENVQAFVEGGNVTMILDNIIPYPNETIIEATERIFKHEVVGHLKMSKVLSGISKDGYNNLIKFLKGLEFKSGDNVWERTKAVYTTEQDGKKTEPEDSEIVDEIFAKLSEQKNKESQSVITKIVNWIRTKFLKAGIKNWTANDLDIIIQQAFNTEITEGDQLSSIRFAKTVDAVYLDSVVVGYGAWISPGGKIINVSTQNHFGKAIEIIGEENTENMTVDGVYDEMRNRGYLRVVNGNSIRVEGGKKPSAQQRAVLEFAGINGEKDVYIDDKQVYKKPDVRFSKSDALWEQYKNTKEEKRLEELYAERNELQTIWYTEEPRKSRMPILEKEINELKEASRNTQEFKAWIKERTKERDEEQFQGFEESKQKLLNNKSWDVIPNNVIPNDDLPNESLRASQFSVPTHSTDIDDVESILQNGLRHGSALDMTKDREWAGTGVSLVVPFAKKGRKIEHNNYYESSGVSAVGRVIIDQSNYTNDLSEKAQELADKFPDVAIEIVNDDGSIVEFKPNKNIRFSRADNQFDFRLADQLKNPDNVMGLVVAKDGTLPTQNLASKIRKSGATEFEVDTLTQLVNDLSENGRVKMSELSEVIDTVPTVVINKLTVGKKPINSKLNRFAEIQHEFETAGERLTINTFDGPTKITTEGDITGDTELEALLQEAIDLGITSMDFEKIDVDGDNPATGKYGVDPYSNRELKGEDEIEPGHRLIWSGDLSLNIPLSNEGRRSSAAFDESLEDNKYIVQEVFPIEEKEGKLEEFMAKYPEPRYFVTTSESSVYDENRTVTVFVRDTTATEKPKFESQHYEGEVAKNQLAFVRGGIHEYQAGNKLPDGTVATKPTRIFEIWEVQSDWAGAAKRYGLKGEAKLPDGYSVVDINKAKGFVGKPKEGHNFAVVDNNGNVYETQEIIDGTSWATGKTKEEAIQRVIDDDNNNFKVNNDPLLKYWESLALKAAVNFAQEQGADKIITSDAETAMMTEGHDKVGVKEIIIPANPENIKRAKEAFSNIGDKNGTKGLTREKLANLSMGIKIRLTERNDNVKYLTTESGKKEWDNVTYSSNEITQEPGMKAAYDERIPNGLKKLTNSTPKKVTVGKHGKGKSEVFNKDTNTGYMFSVPQNRGVLRFSKSQPNNNVIPAEISDKYFKAAVNGDTKTAEQIVNDYLVPEYKKQGFLLEGFSSYLYQPPHESKGDQSWDKKNQLNDKSTSIDELKILQNNKDFEGVFLHNTNYFARDDNDKFHTEENNVFYNFVQSLPDSEAKNDIIKNIDEKRKNNRDWSWNPGQFLYNGWGVNMLEKATGIERYSNKEKFIRNPKWNEMADKVVKMMPISRGKKLLSIPPVLVKSNKSIKITDLEKRFERDGYQKTIDDIKSKGYDLVFTSQSSKEFDRLLRDNIEFNNPFATEQELNNLFKDSLDDDNNIGLYSAPFMLITDINQKRSVEPILYDGNDNVITLEERLNGNEHEIIKATRQTNIRFSKSQPQANTQEKQTVNEVMDDDFLMTDNNLISNAKSDASREYGRLLKRKLGQKLMIKEVNVYNAFEDIQYAYLPEDRLIALLNDFRDFVNTRTTQENPATTRIDVDTLESRLIQYKKDANQAEYNYWKDKIEKLPDFVDGFNEDIGAVRAMVYEIINENKREDLANMSINDSDVATIEAIHELQFMVIDRVDEVDDIINRGTQEFAQGIKESGHPILDKGITLMQDHLTAMKKLFNEYTLNLVTIDPTELSKADMRRVYYALLSLSTDGYPNRLNGFISSEIQNLLKTAEAKFTNPYGTVARTKTSKWESTPSMIERMATDDYSYDLLIKLQAPLRDGLALAKRYHEEIITPYVEEINSKYGVMDADTANKIGIFGTLRQRFMTETPEEALKNSFQWLLDSNENITGFYDASYRAQGNRHNEYIFKLFDGINYKIENKRVVANFTKEDVAQFYKNANIFIGEKGIKYADDVVRLFESFKPLARFTTEFIYGRTFEEVDNYIPTMSVIIKGEGNDLDMSKVQMMTDAKSFSSGQIFYGTNTTGLGSTKQRTRTIGTNRTLVLNINYMAESLGRVAVYDYFTANARQEMAQLLNYGNKNGKMLAKFLGDPDQALYRMAAFRDAMNGMWQNVMSQASYLHPYHVLTNWLGRKWAQGVLSGVHQFPAQAVSNTIPYFVQHINEPGKIANLGRAISYIIKYQSGMLDETQTKLMDKILFEVMHRQQFQEIDKSVNLNISPNSFMEGIKKHLPLFYKSIREVDSGIEKFLFRAFKWSDIVSGAPMMLAEYLNNEQTSKGTHVRLEDLTYDPASYHKAIDSVERYIGIGDASRRGEFLTNKNAGISIARNLLIAFRSFSINNAVNFGKEWHRIHDSEVSSAQKVKSIKHMLGIVAQSVIYTKIATAIGGMVANQIINAIRHPEEEEELKDLYRKSQNRMSQAERKNLELEISMREQLRKITTSIENKASDKRVIYIRTAKDALSNMVPILNIDLIPNLFIHLGLDEQAEENFKEWKSGEIERIEKQLKRHKNLGNYKTVTKLTEELSAVNMQEFLPAVFEKRSIAGLGGSFGGTAEGIVDAAESSVKAWQHPEAMTPLDFLQMSAMLGVSQPDIKKLMRAYSKKVEIEKNYEEASSQ